MKGMMTAFLSAAALVSAHATQMRPALCQPPPREAAVALSVTNGVAVETGLVFVNGHYVAPPYVVSRYGTVLRINGEQVSGEVVPWAEFKRTQRAKSSQGMAEASVGLPDPKEDEDPLAVVFSQSRRPKENMPTFELNEQARELLAKIEARRLRVETSLLAGECRIYGTGAAPIIVSGGEANRFLMELPDLLRHNVDYASFAAAVREAKFGFLTEVALRDLFENRLEYPRLATRRKRLREAARSKRLAEEDQ